MSSDDDVAARGRAIFERLRQETPASDSLDQVQPLEHDSETPAPVDHPVGGGEAGATEVEVEPEPAELLEQVQADTPAPEPLETPDPEVVEPAERQVLESEARPAEDQAEVAAEASEPDGFDAVPAPPDRVGVLGPPAAAPAAPGDGDRATPAAPAPTPAAPAPTPAAPVPTARIRPPLPRVLAIANQKGGVGKTTTAVNLGAALAEMGYRVLVVDLDPQGNATTGLGINPRNLASSVYDVIMHDAPIDDCVEPTSVRNLFVCPATIDLAGAEIELVPAFSRELKLRRALEAVRDDYDFTLIDCPPSLGLITVNGLAAASEVVVPIQCEYYALEGLGQLLRNVNLVQANLNPRLEVSAIILTMYDARTKLAEHVAGEVRLHFGDKVCRNIVPRTVRLSEAPSFGQPIVVFDPTSRGAIAYRELAKEVSGGAPQRVG